MTFESGRDGRQIADLMRESVDHLHQPDRWNEIPARGRARIRRRRVELASGAALALAAAVAVAVVVPSSSGGHKIVTVNPNPSIPSITAPPTTTRPSSGAVTPQLPAGYVPLFPFSSGEAVAAWETAYRTSGAQPWHLDHDLTAVAFAAYLGYSDVNQAESSRTGADGAHVSVGFTLPNGSPHVAAVVHLVRFGTDPDAPWEVVGTDDTTFSLTRPAYNSEVSGPVTVGGTITGVDESITVKVFASGSDQASVLSCCHPAGGTDSAWTVPLTTPIPSHSVLVIAASTGGHIAAVERFTVTGVRT